MIFFLSPKKTKKYEATFVIYKKSEYNINYIPAIVTLKGEGIKKVPKPTKFKTKAQKKKAKISWKKVKNIKKYQIAYKKADAKEWTYKTVSKKKSSTTIKKLSSKKKYKFKIRSYRYDDKDKVYSKWSKTKTLKIK